ncbi:MAG: hypothetical protein AB1483_01260 [Candidatus Zixiibacteriota bacterium]
MDDLAVDILGSLFQTKPQRPFSVIFEFYQSSGVRDFEQCEPERLWMLFESLLKGFAHQEISRLKKQANPQVETLKRRFKDILREDHYVTFMRGYEEFIHLKAGKPDFSKPTIPYEELRIIAEEAFAGSNSRTDWCRKIFERLAQAPAYCAAIGRTDLLKAVVAVNVAFLQLPQFGPMAVPGPQTSAIRDAVSAIKLETMKYIDDQVIRPFVTKTRIRGEDSGLFLAACGRYLDDFGHDGDPAVIPDYFREVMPPQYVERYLEDFKYVFETVIDRTKEDFSSRLRKNPIIRQFGVYWNVVE